VVIAQHQQASSVAKTRALMPSSNNGTSTSTPWLTIQKVNTSALNRGDSTLF
jgi:hypothetical protein